MHFATNPFSYCPERSLEFIEKYSREEYSVLLCHDD